MYHIKALIGEHDREYKCILFCQCITTIVKWKDKCQATFKLHKLNISTEDNIWVYKTTTKYQRNKIIHEQNLTHQLQWWEKISE